MSMGYDLEEGKNKPTRYGCTTELYFQGRISEGGG